MVRILLSALLLVPILSVSSQAQGTFVPPRIIESWIEPNLGYPPHGGPVHAYLLDQGSDSNINTGDVLKVYRQRVFDPNEAPMRFFIGTMTMREVRYSESVGIFEPNDSAINRLMIRFQNAMEGDLVAPQLILEASLLFDSGQAELREGANDELAKVASFIGVFAPHKLIVEGHSDSDGQPESNLVLSEERAIAVREFLVNRYDHIRPAMVEAIGYGEEQPRAPNDTPDNKAKNRRIEFVVID